jgi:hypothetical protein
MSKPHRDPFGRTCVAAGAVLAALPAAPAQAAVNSYRFMHVTIDTPWHIFLFLLIGIFAPFILMVVLMWRNSLRKRDQARAREPAAPPPAPKDPA